MKKLLLSFTSLLLTLCLSAQVEYIIDFNNYAEGSQNLNGQDNWSTHYQTAPTSPDFNVGYNNEATMAPDESLCLWYPYGGPGVGRTATRKASSNFDFSFQQGGNIDLEFDLHKNWWGVYGGVGYDADGDGNILPGMVAGEGGVFLQVRSVDGVWATTLTTPTQTYQISLNQEDTYSWIRVKLSFNFDDYDGEGAVTVFIRPRCEGDEWLQIADGTALNLGLTPGSGDVNDYQVWDGLFFHSQGGVGAFDNILVRQQPEGNAQLIEMADVPNQLIFNEPITLNATATSGLPVSFVMIEGPAAIDGNILTLSGEPGIVKFKAVQGGNEQWLPAPDVIKTFEVVDPNAYTPDVTIRRPYDNTKVYMDELHPMLLVVSAYIEHPEVIKFTEISCAVDGQNIELFTYYPNDPTNGYYYANWTPSAFGTYNMTVSVTTSGDITHTYSNSFEVTNQIDNTLDVVTLNGDLVCTPTVHSARGDYAMPSHVGAFNNINVHYDHNCVNASCDTYDRFGGLKIRNYRGEWIELFRYISPFGVECEDNLDVTDYTSMLQGLVEFEYYFETWNGQGYNPIVTFTFTKGTPEYLFVDVDEIWFGVYSFGDYANQFPVPVVNYQFSEHAQAAKLKLSTTGHNWSSGTDHTNNTGNAAEFYEATHNIKLNGTQAYTQHLWRTCNPNPAGCQPQNGTWPHNRSGWCPGSIALVWDYDISQYVSAGNVELFYEFDPTYLDLCHPNHPDCVDGETCVLCAAPNNPVLRVAGKVLTYSNDDDVFTSVHPAVEEPTLQVSLYPNPANDKLTVETDYDLGKINVLVINAEGREVMNFTVDGKRTVDVSHLPSGIYLVKMLGGSMITQKIIIE